VGGGIALHARGVPAHHRTEQVAPAAAAAAIPDGDVSADAAPSDSGAPSAGTQVNPYWQSLNQLFTTAPPTGDVGATYPTSQRTGDDGIVLFRVFIPAQGAAANRMRGDNRGFSDDPAASSRADVAWDTGTGKIAVVVHHSAYGPVSVFRDGDPIPALDLSPNTDWQQAFDTRDQNRSDNRVGLDPQAPANTLHLRLSLLNPLTHNDGPLGAWTVDQEATITRTGPGAYQLQLDGNGYPAVESYYYPRYAPQPDSTVIAKRSVEPYFLTHQGLDAGGGEAALDADSWVHCQNTGSSVFQCTNTIKEIAQPNGEGVTIVPMDEAPWTTTNDQTNAMQS
jgi:hypothetical protein